MNKAVRIVSEFETKLLNKFMSGEGENDSEDEDEV